MDKLRKYKKGILAGILLIIGICSVIFGKNLAVQGGVTCVSWGLAIFVLIWISISRNEQELNNFNIQAQEILVDIAEKGVESDYYQYYDVEVINKLRTKLLKKQRKQIFSFVALGIILLILAIICMI